MEILPPLINDLGLILITAAVSVVLFKILKQPLVLGYIIAGYLAGPYFNYLPTVKDAHSIEVWAEIGVIFLLFSLGLEFSFKKLMEVGGSAFITGVFQAVFMLIAGYFTGLLLDWTTIDSIFLGAMLSMSSTTIIIKSLEELNLKGKKFVSLVFGALIIEDIVAILLMVLLTTIAVSKQFSGMELFLSFLKLSFFLIIWFLVGIFVIPSMLKKVKKHLNDEMLLIVSLGLCLLMVVLGAKAGFSSALGAFVMGSIIAGTIFSERIEKLIEPVKNLFGAIFFVSVGMMINPSTLVEYFFPVVLITVIAIIGKVIFTTTGALIAGQPLNQSVQTGMSHTPIGEFSFIIATLGMSLGVISDFLYPIIVAVSTITIFLTPYLMKETEKMVTLIERILPGKVKTFLENYSSNMLEVKSKSAWQICVRNNVIHVVLMSVVIIAINLISFSFLKQADELIKHGGLLLTVATLLLLLPFIWSLAFHRINTGIIEELRKDRKLRTQVTLIFIFRLGLALLLLGMYLNTFFSFKYAVLAFTIVILISLIFPRKIQKRYRKFENRFIENYNSRENTHAKERKSYLTPWDGHMTKVIVPQESSITGMSLDELSLREKFGINVAVIKRGDISIYIPTRSQVIFPNDILFIIGSDEQIEGFVKFMNDSMIETVNFESPKYVLKNIELVKEDFCHKSIKESKIRELTSGLIVGIEHDGERILNPQSDVMLEKGDIVWIVGEKERMKVLEIDYKAKSS